MVPMKRPRALIAAAPRPGTCSGSAAASQMGIPTVLAKLSTLARDVAPIPRRGELTMRVNAPTSWGLIMTVR